MFLIIRKIYLSLYRTHVSKDVIYRMIRQGSIPSYNFGQRLTRLSRQYMDEHFKAKNRSKKRKKETLSFEPKDCYTIGEIAKKFHINDSSVFKHIRRHSIPTCQIGNYVYVPKSEIDKLYKSL
ncbi:excisionase family DNA-binding protein [Phocaeicola plebeius]|nr:excisionase family DNA-binding protein [Phocaeicola plebeius]